MNDTTLFKVLDRMAGATRITVRNHRFVFLGAAFVPGSFVIETRVGKGERWSFAPSRDVVREVPTFYGREVVRWAEVCIRADVGAYLRGMSARTL